MVRQASILKVYVMTVPVFIYCFKRNLKLKKNKKLKTRMLRCATCNKMLIPGDIVVSKGNSTSMKVHRDLDCAINKLVLTANVVDI